MPWRFGLAAAILLAEYLAFSYAFDAQNVIGRGGLWVVVGRAGAVAPLLVVGAAALLQMRLSEAGEAKPSAKECGSSPRWLLLAAHVPLLGGLAWLTQLSFGRAGAPPGPPWIWFGGWLLLAAATAATLVVGVVGKRRSIPRLPPRALAIGIGLAVAAWALGWLSTGLWPVLSRATLRTASTVLRFGSFEPLTHPDRPVLYLEGFSISVAPVCSGLEGIGLFAVLMLGFLVYSRSALRFPHALLLLPVGALAVWLGNVLRLAALMVLGARVDAAVALGAFHSKAGWILFCGVTLGLVWWARSSPFFARQGEQLARSSNPAVPLLLPVLTWIGVGLVTSAFSDGPDPLYVVRVVAAASVLWAMRSAYRQWLQMPSISAWIVGGLVGGLWLLVPPLATASGSSGSLPDPEWSELGLAGWVASRLLGSILVVPVCEELAFRGHLARWLTRRQFWEVPFAHLSLLGLLGSSLAFGLMHERWILATATGMVYAVLLRRSGRLSDAVAAHAASNAVIAVWVATTGCWQQW